MRNNERIWIDVKRLRLERGWLQREAAGKLGVTRGYLSSVENDKRDISKKMIASIIKVFAVKFEDFCITREKPGQPNAHHQAGEPQHTV